MDLDRVKSLVFTRGDVFVNVMVDLFDILDVILGNCEKGLIIGKWRESKIEGQERKI